MQELSLQFNYRARYYKFGKIDKDNQQIWFVLHGYGQLAQYFIKKFKWLEHKGICVIAPEGLSRFYLEDIPTRVAGGSNRVGATWMTKENREMDIENYINYLQAIYDSELKHFDNAHVTLLGFSQGAATVTRWAISNKPQFQRFILWAGIFPPDMNFETGKNILSSKEVVTVYGTGDPFITPARKEEMGMLCKRLEVTPKQILFEGGHDIIDEALQELI
jgi:predicted esterase